LCPLRAQALEKWFYHATNLLVDKNVDQLETLWATGFRGRLHARAAHRLEVQPPPRNGPRYFKNVERVKKIAAETKIEIVPAVFPVGYSNDISART
jgi:hypothetical protein